MQFTESNVCDVLRRYDELDEHADAVATIVYATRFGNNYRDSFENSFDVEGGTVTSSYYWRNERDSVTWPLDLMWADDDEIVRRTQNDMANEKRRLDEKAEQQRAENERRERATYERLKAKYDHPS